MLCLRESHDKSFGVCRPLAPDGVAQKLRIGRRETARGAGFMSAHDVPTSDDSWRLQTLATVVSPCPARATSPAVGKLGRFSCLGLLGYVHGIWLIIRADQFSDVIEPALCPTGCTDAVTTPATVTSAPETSRALTTSRLSMPPVLPRRVHGLRSYGGCRVHVSCSAARCEPRLTAPPTASRRPETPGLAHNSSVCGLELSATHTRESGWPAPQSEEITVEGSLAGDR